MLAAHVRLQSALQDEERILREVGKSALLDPPPPPPDTSEPGEARAEDTAHPERLFCVFCAVCLP